MRLNMSPSNTMSQLDGDNPPMPSNPNVGNRGPQNAPTNGGLGGMIGGILGPGGGDGGQLGMPYGNDALPAQSAGGDMRSMGVGNPQDPQVPQLAPSGGSVGPLGNPGMPPPMPPSGPPARPQMQGGTGALPGMAPMGGAPAGNQGALLQALLQRIGQR